MNIDLDSYLSEEEKKEIAIKVFAEKLNNSISDEPERVLSNMAYYMIFDMIDKELNCDSKEIIKAKAVSIINNLTEFSVFHNDRYGYDSKESIAQKYLDEAVENSKSLIKDRVLAIINRKLSNLEENGEHKITEIIEDVVSRVFYEKLTSKE